MATQPGDDIGPDENAASRDDPRQAMAIDDHEARVHPEANAPTIAATAQSFKRPLMEQFYWLAGIGGALAAIITAGVAAATYSRTFDDPSSAAAPVATQVSLPAGSRGANAGQGPALDVADPLPEKQTLAREATIPSATASAPRTNPRPNYVNIAAFNPTGPAVLITGPRGTNELAQTIAAGIGGTDSLFKPQFVSDGHFTRAYSGDASVLTSLNLAHAASYIVLGTHELTVTSQEVAGQPLVKAESVVSLRVYRAAAGFSSLGFTEHAVAAGFSASDAERDADAAVANKIVAKLSAFK